MSNQTFTVATFKERKANKTPVTMLTAYDYSTAQLVEEAGIDTILVGDSLGNVMLGYGSTLPVTVEDMIHHGKAVCRGAKNTFVVVDMPFMSYQVSAEKAVENAGRILKETGCQAVKLEGGAEIPDPSPGGLGLSGRQIPGQGTDAEECLQQDQGGVCEQQKTEPPVQLHRRGAREERPRDLLQRRIREQQALSAAYAARRESEPWRKPHSETG